jgi:hypothetical protein
MLLLSLQTPTDSVEIIGGSLTYHLLGNDFDSNSNKVSNDGRLIANPLFGLQYTTENNAYYESMALFSGDNSVGTQILGVKAAKGIKIGNLYLGLALGAYEQDDTEFNNRGIIPFEIGRLGTTGIVPVFGAEVNYKIVSYKDVFVKINNIISPVLTNTTLSVGVSF